MFPDDGGCGVQSGTMRSRVVNTFSFWLSKTVIIGLVWFTGCGPGSGGPDAGQSDAGQPDAGNRDAGDPDGFPYDFQAAAAYSALHDGACVLVQIDGEIVFEEVQNGAEPDTAFHIHSATKAFWASACAAALDDGLLDDIDQNVSQTIVEWQDFDLHGGKRLITLKDLLELTSGLSQDVDQIQGLDARADDIYQYVIDELRLLWQPGSRFQYGPSHFYAFGVLLQRRLERAGMDPDPLAYLQARILDPIGVTFESWARDPAGNPHIPNGAHLTAREWVRYGQFLLQEGRWEGSSIVSSERMQQMRIPGTVNPGHGKFLWLNTQEGWGNTEQMRAPPGSAGGFIYHHGHPDLFAALGAGKNRMYMIPALHMVVLRQTSNSQDGFVDHEFLQALLGPQP